MTRDTARMSGREQRPVTALRGVGDALAKVLARLGIAQVQDLLFLLPQRYEDRTGEIYAATYSPAHRWYYMPKMRADETLLLKCYDSLTDGTARFAPHTAFADPATPKDAPPRESIDIRTIAFYA